MMLSTCQATDDDLAFLEDVFLRAMRVHITAARGTWDEARERSQFCEQLRLWHAQIIKQSGLRVGFYITLESGADVELHTLCIAPEHQGQGLGSDVTRQILSDARARNRDGVVLSVLKPNTAARSLYERLGFTINEERTHHYRMRLAL
jgi:ribosomal protein S18 acetylase RimI-like enzyme